MKILTTIFLLLLTTATVWCQDEGDYEKYATAGNRYFEHEQYNLAIQFYLDALGKNYQDPLIDYRLAECYRHTFDYKEAETYYMKVLYTKPDQFPLSLYYYALMLKLNGNLPEAIERFDQFILLHEGDLAFADFHEQAVIDRAGCEISQLESVFPTVVETKPLEGPINSPFNDFAPAFRNSSSMVITSSRITSNRKLIDERNGEAFTDNYYFEKNGSLWEDKTRWHFSVTNSPYHDGSGTFTRNGNEYFFTVCEESCKIFETHILNNRWSKPVLLNESINLPGSDSKQPAVSPGGDTLYFASNRAGGHGQFDIWVSVDAGNNNWGPAINAGRTINTKANEIAPSITDIPSVLFFSSEGHPGYGGFDLFVAKANSIGDTLVYNLNFPFNSVKDDCFLTFHDRQVLWSSNRDGGKGGFDVYHSSNITALGLVSRLSLKNRNDSRVVTLTSRTARSENIHLLASRNEETIDYNNLTYERKSLVNRMVENRLNNIENIPQDFAGISPEEFDMLNEVSHARFQTLLLKQKYASTLLTEVQPDKAVAGPLSVTGQVIDPEGGYALANAKVLLTNEYGEILKITSTNSEGQFRFTDVPGDTRLFLRLENASVGNRRKHVGKNERQSIARASVRNLQTHGSDKQNTLYVENVYFDFDHYIIRPEAAQVLSELAIYLKSNPGAQVEIYAFADDRGGSAYNFELTQKRGEAVVAYLTSYGVDETSLAIVPKGKQTMRLATNEAQRQYNRRAEFYINGVRETFTPAGKTYILKREADWNLIATLTGVSEQELKNLNGSASENVKAFQPIRVPKNAKAVSEELFYVGI